MRPIVATVGPLISASATKIAASQALAGAQPIVLNGASGTYTANNVAASQTLGAAGALTLIAGVTPKTTGLPGGTLVGVNIKGYGAVCPKLYITSGGNDSGITFTIVGVNPQGTTTSEVVTGSNTSIVSSVKSYQALFSITASGATASTVTVGTYLPVTLDTARRVLITSGGNDAGITWTITGTDQGGNPISETLTGTAGATPSNLSYLNVLNISSSGATASTVTVGTNGVADTVPVTLEPWAGGTIFGQVTVSGTVNYTVFVSNDDPNDPSFPVTESAIAWDSSQTSLIGQTGSAPFQIASAPHLIKTTLNSGSGSVRMTVIQNLGPPQ